MNGKFLLILFLCINLSTLVASSVCSEQVNDCKLGNNIILTSIIPQSSIDAFEDDPTQQAGAGFNEEFTGAVGESLQEQGSGTSTDTNIFGFLDVVKMVLGVVSLLTPIPFIAFMVSAGLPLLVIFLVGIVPVLLYILAFMEFLRGASF